MPRKYTPKPSKHWANKAQEDALAERKIAGTPIRKLAEKYGVPKSTLSRHLNEDITRQRRKAVFTTEEFNDLKDCIVTLADLGFGLTIKDIGELVESYVMFNEHQRGIKSFKHNNRAGYPGPDWIKGIYKSK